MATHHAYRWMQFRTWERIVEHSRVGEELVFPVKGREHGTRVIKSFHKWKSQASSGLLKRVEKWKLRFYPREQVVRITWTRELVNERVRRECETGEILKKEIWKNG